MSVCSCHYTRNCSIAALIASLILGVVAAFLQITAVITITPVILWVLFGIAVGLLAVLTLASALLVRCSTCKELCPILRTVQLGILGTVLFAGILLTVGITATSVISAILIGLLLFFFSLALTSLTCYIQCIMDCEE